MSSTCAPVRPQALVTDMGLTKKIGQYFLENYVPFTGKKTLKIKAFIVLAVLLTLGAVGYIMVAGNAAEKSDATAKTTDKSVGSSQSSISQNGSKNSQSSGKPQGTDYVSVHPNQGYGNSRNYSASQVVKADSGFGRVALPLAFQIPAVLSGRIVTSDAATPTIAIIPQDVAWEDEILIPEGSKALGQTTFDESTHRVQLRFSAVVFPDGSSHSFSGLAMSTDGAAGLSGDYHSGTIGQQVGKFLSMFIGGLSDGMKDRQPSQAPMTPPYEPGSLRNGALNGVAVTSSEFAKSKSQELERSKPFMEIPGGTALMIFLDKEFSP